VAQPTAEDLNSSDRAPAVGWVAVLAAGVAGISIAAAGAWLTSFGPIMSLPGVTLLTLTAAFALAEALPAHFQHRREAVSFTLTTIPLVIGLVAVDPLTLILARVGGSALALVVRYRQQPLKLATNLASFLAQTVVAIAVFRGLTSGAAGPSQWLGIVLAVLAGDAAQTCVLAAAISLYQRRWEPGLRDSAIMSSIAVSIEASVGIVAVTLLAHEPAALLPLGVVAALVLISLRTHRSLSERHRELGELYKLTSTVGDALVDRSALLVLLDHARDLLRAERAWLYLDGDGGHLQQISMSSAGASAGDAPDGATKLRDAAGAAGEPLHIRESDDAHRQLLAATGASELLVAPLTGPSGSVGTLVVADRSGDVRDFLSADAQLLATVANHVSALLENLRLVDRLRQSARDSEHQSLHDPLTGLPNRVLFMRELEAAVASGSPAAVLLLDLDRFKEVNDTLGHHNGDLLLQQVGTRLRGALRRGDMVARLGGDEFAVLLPDIEGATGAVHVGRGIVDLLEQPFSIGDMRVDVGASIGIAVSPRDGDDPATLVRRADVAMYTAKAEQSGVEAYAPERDGYSADRLALVADLRLAIHDGALDVYYQPQVDLVDGSLLGVEALVRWPHPTRGMVQPNDFIGVAEHTGLIHPLTRFVLEEALKASRRWRREGHAMRMSVNLSARSLLDPELTQDVAHLLKEYDVPRGGLCLEVTESSMMADLRRTIATVEALAALGVTIALDDFGTGHSSLAYVKGLPVGEIKVDRSFVSSMIEDHTDEAIVRTILELARNLEIPVVAEGVEDVATSNRLRAMGCPTAQGYLFGKPMPASELENWIADRARESLPV
jgi:diguanylate cyclase (GGDEF)-like protein